MDAPVHLQVDAGEGALVQPPDALGGGVGVRDRGENAPMVRRIAMDVEEPNVRSGTESARDLLDGLDGTALAQVRYQLHQRHRVSISDRHTTISGPEAVYFQENEGTERPRRAERRTGYPAGKVILDRKETEFRADEAAEQERRGQASSEDAVSASGGTGPRTDELFRQGEEHFAAGRFQQAIHIWTRILFVERGSSKVRESIDKAKRVIAERQRRLDLECAEAGRLFDAGDVEEAGRRARVVLSADPSHVEANRLSEKVEALERRNEPARELSLESSSEAGPSKGIVLRVPKAERGRPRAGAGADAPADSRLKMFAFIAAGILVFAASALYLYENWEGIVSDGAFRHPTSGASVAVAPPAPAVPDLAELRYYNGARLFEQGRYREALAELSRVDRGSRLAAPARSLILRIEERLLRGVSEDEASALPPLAPSAAEEPSASPDLTSQAEPPAESEGSKRPGGGVSK
jgi:tetratricopeptide (TPR) repeat protein